MSIFGATKEIGLPVAIPVDNGRGGVVAGDDPGIDGPFVVEEEDARILADGDLAKDVDVQAVDQKVEPAVSRPSQPGRAPPRPLLPARSALSRSKPSGDSWASALAVTAGDWH